MEENEQVRSQEPQGDAPTLNNASPATGHKPIGPAVGIIVIIAILLLGGIYFWMQARDEVQYGDQPYTDALPGADSKVQALQQQSSSDKVSDIEADLQSTDLDNLDAELNSVTF